MIPDFFNVQNESSDRQVAITIVETENLELLILQNNNITYALKVLETDLNTNFVSTKTYNVHFTNFEVIQD